MVKDTTMPIPASPDAPRGLPLVFVPGLNCTAELFEPQIAQFRDRHPIIVADHASDETIADIAKRLLASAPPKFALIGLSMGGYVAMEVMRQAPQRVAKLALIDTRASQDVQGDTEIRQAAIKMAETGRFDDIHHVIWPRIVHIRRLGDSALEAIVKTMSDKTGPARFIRQQKAIMGRPSYEASLAAIRCPTLIWWARTTRSPRASCPRTWRMPSAARNWWWCRIADTCRRWRTRLRSMKRWSGGSPLNP